MKYSLMKLYRQKIKKAAALAICGAMLVEGLFIDIPSVSAGAFYSEPVNDFYMHGSGHDITEDDSSNLDARIQQSGKSLGARTNISKAAAVAAMTASDNAFAMIKGYEGIVYADETKTTARAYDDKQPSVILTEETEIKGTLTIGYGHTGAINGQALAWDTVITVEEAEAVLVSDVSSFQDALNKFLIANSITLNQDQFDALISFTYNVGGGVWSRSSDWTLRTMLKNGISNYSNDDVIEAFSLWNKSGGKILSGLTRRRRKEAAMFLGDPTLADYKLANYKVASETLTVRTGPGASFPAVVVNNQDFVLAKDTVITITEINNKYWGKIEGGWIQLDYCRLTTDPASEINPVQPTTEEALYPVGFYRVTAASLNIREGAGDNYAVKKQYKKGTVIKVDEVVGKWGKTVEGWTSLKCCEPYTLAETSFTKASNVATGICLKWKTVADADGYYIYKIVEDEWIQYYDSPAADGAKFVDRDTIEGEKFSYMICAYKNVDGAQILSNPSGEKINYKLSRVVVKSIKSPSKGAVKLTWKKKSKANGYEIQYATGSAFKNATKLTISKNSTKTRTITRLKSKKTYFFRIRSYKVVNGIKYYSAWCAARSIKVY